MVFLLNRHSSLKKVKLYLKLKSTHIWSMIPFYTTWKQGFQRGYNVRILTRNAFITVNKEANVTCFNLTIRTIERVNASVIRRLLNVKAEVTRKQAKFPAKANISYTLIRNRTCAYQGIRNNRLSKNLACFDFLLPPSWNSSFCLITDDWSMMKLSCF